MDVKKLIAQSNALLKKVGSSDRKRPRSEPIEKRWERGVANVFGFGGAIIEHADPDTAARRAKVLAKFKAQRAAAKKTRRK